MNAAKNATHQERIVDEFTQRAEAFASTPAITDPEALQLLLQMSEARAGDTALDVACGAGVVLCAFAPVVRHATGIDITPAMIQRAMELQREKGLQNISWQIGDSRNLPFADNSFSIVLTRYSFHHMQEPAATFSEMARVCAPGGRVLLADVCDSSDSASAATFNAMERLRDPSHVRALSREEMTAFFLEAGLANLSTASYAIEFKLQDLIQHSSASAPDLDRIRALVADELQSAQPSIPARVVNGEIVITYPILVLCATKRF